MSDEKPLATVTDFQIGKLIRQKKIDKETTDEYKNRREREAKARKTANDHVIANLRNSKDGNKPK